MDITDEHTVAEAKEYLENHWEDGCDCPACGQNVKLYHRKVTSAMAYGLILLSQHVSAAPSKAIHIEDFFKDRNCPSSVRGDFAKLRWWGLINRHDDQPGYYSLTPKGQYFVNGSVTVPRYCMIFNNECYGFSNEQTDINKALGDQFSYAELMGKEFEAKYNTSSIQTNIFDYE